MAMYIFKIPPAVLHKQKLLYMYRIIPLPVMLESGFLVLCRITHCIHHNKRTLSNKCNPTFFLLISYHLTSIFGLERLFHRSSFKSAFHWLLGNHFTWLCYRPLYRLCRGTSEHVTVQTADTYNLLTPLSQPFAC